ncbi:hypothetical protein A0O28_0050900 [Trichoderma guizhouense]|uniref:Guanine nucleotide-binding protein subunit gamma n=1 Tax=Trichoderma guizhouense TaxID=1491466 RepID=A0A1T3CEA6_9HYPO|nr:hypothetical protein A0O28_0050900 [Trichoderma guizhouense]
MGNPGANPRFVVRLEPDCTMCRRCFSRPIIEGFNDGWQFSQQLRQHNPSSRLTSASHSITLTTPTPYTSRDVGDPTQIKKTKQSMADLKLRRLTELNNRLREDLDRERIPVSTASKSIIAYCNGTRDYMVPSVWGTVPKGEDPYAPQQSGGCCVVM